MPLSRSPGIVLLTATVLLGAGGLGMTKAQSTSSPATPHSDPLPLREWGAETLRTIDRHLWIADRGLYAEEASLDGSEPRQPAFMWGAGVQLSALAAAARAEPDRYADAVRRYADALQVYWTEHDGIGGFDVLPAPKPADRYYDDNVWIVLALAEIYEITGDETYRDRAEATYRFVLSGEDERLGGGIYWHEPSRETKNTCSNAPAIVAGLRLYQLTGDPEHLATARRLYAWTNEWLQDPEDHLYWDNVDLEGEVDERKYSYNTALMIRANTLFHEITSEARYLEEARRIAESAEARWVDAETGGIEDGGRFAHMLLEAFLALDRHAHDARWPRIVRNALAYVHAEVRDPNGHYPNRWDRPQNTTLESFALLDEASAARAYWVAAVELRE